MALEDDLTDTLGQLSPMANNTLSVLDVLPLQRRHVKRVKTR